VLARHTCAHRVDELMRIVHAAEEPLPDGSADSFVTGQTL